MKNLNLKIASILIAILLAWFVENNNSVISVVSPIEFQGLPAEKVILSSSASRAQITVRGPSYQVSPLAIQPPVIQLELPDSLPSSLKLNIRDDAVNLPQSVRVLDIDPREIDLKIDTLIKKTVPISAPTVGMLDEKFKLENLTVSPATVEVTGPSSEIRLIDSVQTAPLELSTITGDGEFDLSLSDPGKFSQLPFQSAKATLKLSIIHVERAFPGLAVEIRGAPGVSYLVNPSSVNVEVSGPKAAVEKLRKEDIIPFVRVSDEKLKSAPVAVDLPREISLISVEPSNLQITIETGKKMVSGKSQR